MTHPDYQEWLNLLFRMAHFISGIMWIGSSFYFVWMDRSFEPVKPAWGGVTGELYMVHGGQFYRVERRQFGAGEMPSNLHWFKWEATFTWITGFILLWVVYYTTNGAYLVDPAVRVLEPWQATAIGVGALVGGWVLYDGLFRSPLARTPLINPVALALAGGLVWFLTSTFSGRGAFIHLGAVFGTIMVLNVWVHILPNQRAIIRAAEEGREPDYELGKKAKRRSMHNSYMTLPVLFTMISNHFASLHGHKHNAVVLVLVILAGALVRHTMITARKLPALAAAVIIGVLMFMTRPPALVAAAQGGGAPVSFAEARAVIEARCVACHATRPSDPMFAQAGPPVGVMLDTPERMKAFAPRIYERACVQKTMPMVNKTGMTDAERDVLARWVGQGAPLD